MPLEPFPNGQDRCFWFGQAHGALPNDCNPPPQFSQFAYVFGVPRDILIEFGRPKLNI